MTVNEFQIPNEQREHDENRLTMRQLDLMMDSLSSYLLEVEGYTQEGMGNIKDDVFDLLSLVGQYRNHRANNERRQEEGVTIQYDAVEEFFKWGHEMDKAIVNGERVGKDMDLL